jgi:hypothetical protein
MAFYRFGGHDKYAEYIGVSESDKRMTRWNDPVIGDPLPDLADWKAPRMEQYLGEHGRRRPRPLADVLNAGFAILVSQRTVDTLDAIWKGQVRLYPVSLVDTEASYWMVVANVIDNCLDRTRSHGKPVKYGGDPSHFAPLEEWVFYPEALQGISIFQLPDSRGPTYVSEAFKAVVIGKKLKGAQFRSEFWDPKPYRT